MSGAVAITVDCGDQGVMHVDVEDTRPGGLIPGEETPSTHLVLKIVKAGEQVVESRVPVEAVRAAFARRRISG